MFFLFVLEATVNKNFKYFLKFHFPIVCVLVCSTIEFCIVTLCPITLLNLLISNQWFFNIFLGFFNINNHVTYKSFYFFSILMPFASFYLFYCISLPFSWVLSNLIGKNVQSIVLFLKQIS